MKYVVVALNVIVIFEANSPNLVILSLCPDITHIAEV